MNKKEAVEKFIKIYKQKELLLDKLQELFGFTDSVMLYDTLFAMENFQSSWLKRLLMIRVNGSSGLFMRMIAAKKNTKLAYSTT
jgi:hypothetical protein